MHDEWMADVLLDRRQFARQQLRTSTQEVIDKAFEAARVEFSLKQTGLNVVAIADRQRSDTKVDCHQESSLSVVDQAAGAVSVIIGPWSR
jgi:hypothetical protein